MEKEYKTYRLKKKINPFLTGSIVVLALFYFFVLSSTVWLPQNSDFQITKMNTPMVESNSERSITLTRWDYSESQKKMQIQFQIENKSYDGKDTYEWAAVDRNKGELKTKAVYQDRKILVVEIDEVPKNWSIISLRMGMEGQDPNQKFLFKVYGNETNIRRIPLIDQTDKNDYYIYDLENEIALNRKEIKKQEKVVDEQGKKLKELQMAIDAKTSDLKYMTEKEVEDATEEIAALENTVESYESNILDAKNMKEEYEQRIVKLQEKIEIYKKSR